MKKNTLYLFSFGLTSVLLCASVFAQESRRNALATSNLYVISAKPGGVNLIQGSVSVARKAGRSGQLLKGDTLEIGDQISTGSGGRAEILLNPGSFVRLAENSKFEFTTTALEDLQLKLSAGSAIFEVITDNEFSFAVNTPNAKFYVVKTGVYRIDVLQDGTGKIEVWKGKAQIGDVYATEVKSGREAVVKGNQVSVAKFDRDEKDDFEIFSKTRAKELAKVNAKLQERDLRTSLIGSFYNTRWSLYDSYGLWVFSPAFGSYCFLPFGYGWNSPYGYFYPSDIWRYNLPSVIYYPPIRTTPTDTGNQNTLPIRIGANTKTPPMDRQDGAATGRVRPPFEKIQSEIGQFPTEIRSNDSSAFPSVRPSSPTRVQMPTNESAMPVLIPAATTPTKKDGN